ncbi:U-box domain-containing protein 57-like isoform X2 [Carex rostrata]
MEAFENYFKEADLNKDGKISMKGVSFITKFGLPTDVIMQIWRYANPDRKAFLGRLEFFNFLRLVTVAQSGHILTPEIVKSSLYGSAAAKIPAPQMKSVGSTSASRVTPSTAMPQGANGSTSACEQVNIKHICAKLQVALADAAKYRFELNEEICKREKAEMELVSLIQKVEESENALLRELDLSESRQDWLQDENKKLQEEWDNAVKQVEESQIALLKELDLSKTRLDLLQEENKKLQEERDNAVDEVEEVKESQIVLLKELDLSKSRLDLLQEENKKLQEERDNAVKEVEELRVGAGPGSCEAFSKFSMLELQQATENFNNSHKIGEGGFGCVYKGFLRNTMVAIKMLHPESLLGKPEFEQEVAILSTTRHPNLVTLIGTCSKQSALVYEYLPNGSLEDRLVCKGGTPPLMWQMRTRIIGEVCRALLFLHSNKPNPIVHGALNPSNILLDANLVSKLSDFGISRLLIEYTTNTLGHHTENPKGTFAYMDPEFQRSGQITVKSDVYSFGIIVLQLLTGKPPINIIADVENAVNDNSLHSIMDKSAGEWPFVQAQQLTNLGLRCTQMRRRKRPNLESEWKLVESLMMAASSFVLPSFKSQLDDEGIPSYFMCPIFQEVMKDPHLAADGYTYEAEAINGWLDGGHETSPMTNLPLEHLELTPNRALRSAIQEWLQQHP